MTVSVCARASLLPRVPIFIDIAVYACASVERSLVAVRCGEEVGLELRGGEEDAGIQHPLPESAERFGIAFLHLAVVLRGALRKKYLNIEPSRTNEPPAVPAERFFKGPRLLVELAVEGRMVVEPSEGCDPGRERERVARECPGLVDRALRCDHAP